MTSLPICPYCGLAYEHHRYEGMNAAGGFNASCIFTRDGKFKPEQRDFVLSVVLAHYRRVTGTMENTPVERTVHDDILDQIAIKHCEEIEALIKTHGQELQTRDASLGQVSGRLLQTEGQLKELRQKLIAAEARATQAEEEDKKLAGENSLLKARNAGYLNELRDVRVDRDGKQAALREIGQRMIHAERELAPVKVENGTIRARNIQLERENATLDERNRQLEASASKALPLPEPEPLPPPPPPGDPEIVCHACGENHVEAVITVERRGGYKKAYGACSKGPHIKSAFRQSETECRQSNRVAGNGSATKEAPNA